MRWRSIRFSLTNTVGAGSAAPSSRSWIDGEHELTHDFNKMVLEPPVSKGDFTDFFNKFEAGGRYSGALNTRRFRSVTLAANGGRSRRPSMAR